MSAFIRGVAFASVVVLLVAGCGPAAPTARPTSTAVPPPTAPAAAVPPTLPPTPVPPPTETVANQVINAATAARLEQVVALGLPDSFVNAIAFSPDSRTMFTGDRNGEVLVWERDTWEKTIYRPASSTLAADSAAGVYFGGTLALSPDGNLIVTVYGEDGAITGRDREGQVLFTLAYGAPVYGMAISPDGRLLAVGGSADHVLVFDLETRQPAADLISDHEYISNLVFSPDSRTLLVCYERPGNVMKTWDTGTWQETATFTHVTERIDYHDVLFSPDGQELVIASTEDVEIKFLDLATKQVVREFPEHTRAPYQLAFSPDGSLLASASDDGTLRLWDMETGNRVKMIRTNREAGAVAFSPDGTLIAVSVWGEGVQVWGLSQTATGPLPTPTSAPQAGADTQGAPTPLTSATALPTPTATAAPAAASTWFKTYGGRQGDVGWGVLLADDGGYYLVGTTGLEFEPQMRGDIYLIRTDTAGEVLWEKSYERGGYAEGSAIAWASDGNLLISGPAALPSTSGTAIYLLKVNPVGDELWFRTFDGPLDEMGAAWPLEDGGYLLAGNVVDPNDIVADPGAAGYGGLAGRSNVYLARTDAEGNELWSRTYGGANNVMVSDGLQTADGGLLLLATIMYYPENDDDIYLLRVDADGNEVWSRTWEEGMAGAGGLVLTGDGNYLIAGSYSPPEVMDREKRDFLFAKIDPQGNEIWRKTWGDPDAGDDAALLAATADGGSIAVGDTGGALSSWSQDIALLKLDAQGQLLWRQVIATRAHQMYGQIVQHPDGGYVLVGSIARSGSFDIFLIKTDAQGNVEYP